MSNRETIQEDYDEVIDPSIRIAYPKSLEIAGVLYFSISIGLIVFIVFLLFLSGGATSRNDMYLCLGVSNLPWFMYTIVVGILLLKQKIKKPVIPAVTAIVVALLAISIMMIMMILSKRAGQTLNQLIVEIVPVAMCATLVALPGVVAFLGLPQFNRWQKQQSRLLPKSTAPPTS